MALDKSQLEGRTIRKLGVSAPVVLSSTGITPIFPTGDVKNRAPEGVTFVAFVEASYNSGVGVIPPTLQLRFGNVGDWKSTFLATAYSTNPTVIYAADQQAPYTNGIAFNAEVIVTALSGSAVFTAYGWTE